MIATAASCAPGSRSNAEPTASTVAPVAKRTSVPQMTTEDRPLRIITPCKKRRYPVPTVQGSMTISATRPAADTSGGMPIARSITRP